MLVVTEASALSSYGHPLSTPLEGTPTIVALCGGGQLVDFRFFKFHKDLVARGVAVIRDNVGALLFDDNLDAMLHRFEEDANLFSTPTPLPAPELMAPFVATSRTSPEDSRTAFIAFLECHCQHPSSQDIVNYFEKYVEPSQEFALSCPICMSIFISLSKNEHVIYTHL